MVERVGANCVGQVLKSLLDLQVFAFELLRLSVDPFRLHLYEGVQNESFCISWKFNEDGLGERLDVILNTVLYDIVDVSDELLKLEKTLVHVLQVAIDVHRRPGQLVYVWTKLVLQVLEVRHEHLLSVRTDLADDTLVFTQHESKFVVVHLKLLFLEQENLDTLRDLKANTAKALGFVDKSHDIGIKVHAEFIVVRITDDQRGLQTCLGLVDIANHSLEGSSSVLSNLIEENFFIVGALMVYVLAIGKISEETYTLSEKLFFKI